MRASVIATLLFVALLGIGVRAFISGRAVSRAHAGDKLVIVENKKGQVLVSQPQPAKSDRGLLWKDTATGEFKSSSPEALDDALRAASEKVARQLRKQNPPIEWTPSPEFVRRHLVRHVKEEPRELTDSNAPMTYRTTLELEMTNDSYQKVVEEDRKYRVEQRMWWLARVIGGLVLILVAVAGYIRLDDVTKGYYSIPLRIGAILLGLAGAVVLWWIV